MITQIIWLLSWPLLIAISYYSIIRALKRYQFNEDGSSAEDPMKKKG